MHRKADVGDRALAQPRHEIEAHRGGERQDSDEQQQIFEPAGDVARGAARCEALVDDQLEGIGHARRRRSGDQQRQRRDGDVAGIVERKAPHHPQVPDRATARTVGSGGHCRSLTARPRSLKCRPPAATVFHTFAALPVLQCNIGLSATQSALTLVVSPRPNSRFDALRRL